MDEIKKINELIIDLKNNLKDLERMSHTEYAEISSSIKKNDLAFFIDRIDTDKMITAEIFEDLIDRIYKHNLLITDKINEIIPIVNELEDIKVLKNKLELRENMLKEENSRSNIINNNTQSVTVGDSNSAPKPISAPSKKTSDTFMGFINSVTGKIIIGLALVIIAVLVGLTPDNIIDIIKEFKW